MWKTIAADAVGESPLWAEALLPEEEQRRQAVFSRLVPGRHALGIETIYEGYLVHHAPRGRVFAAPDREQGLLLGDYLYATGLVRICEAGDVDAIEIETYGPGFEIVKEANPQTPYQAKFSLAYCVSAALLEGRLGLPQFAADRFDARAHRLGLQSAGIRRGRREHELDDQQDRHDRHHERQHDDEDQLLRSLDEGGVLVVRAHARGLRTVLKV